MICTILLRKISRKMSQHHVWLTKTISRFSGNKEACWVSSWHCVSPLIQIAVNASENGKCSIGKKNIKVMIQVITMHVSLNESDSDYKVWDFLIWESSCSNTDFLNQFLLNRVEQDAFDKKRESCECCWNEGFT